MHPDDVPSPIDLREMSTARTWAATAMEKRPYRAEVFDRIVRELETARPTPRSLLELGSGPGFLIERVLRATLALRYVALDFSPAMHTLAAERLGVAAQRVTFVERDFTAPDWPRDLGTFDSVATVQAVHELRHKRRAAPLHAQVRDVLAPNGLYLLCDHFVGPGGMTDEALYMRIDEHEHALRTAGFSSVVMLLQLGSTALFRAS